jgi:hypothetical protein
MEVQTAVVEVMEGHDLLGPYQANSDVMSPSIMQHMVRSLSNMTRLQTPCSSVESHYK